MLAWGHRYENFTAELRVADIDTREIQKLDSTNRVADPQWSADGTTLFYLRDVPNPQPGDYDRIWKVPLNGTPAPFGEHDYTAISPARDGRLAIECGTNICVSGPDGANPDTMSAGRSPLWSADSNWIAFVRGTTLVVIHPDGTGLTELTTMDGDPHWLSWSPDDKAVALELEKNLWVAPVDGAPVKMFPYAQLPSWTNRRAF
jgi:Tol biopolymer transport system component